MRKSLITVSFLITKCDKKSSIIFKSGRITFSFLDMMLYQYFVEVVPTDIRTLLSTSKTYQYSVKDHQRPIDHHKGSHGIPGIFFKYDMSALKIKVTQERDTIFQFLVKLCATVGGIFVTSGKCLHISCNYFFRLSLVQRLMPLGSNIKKLLHNLYIIITNLQD